ncbi:GPO family capsid scaffolding protein [Providencia sp.]|uniref:GPO family capsid scaffolding protein n=1 Tax=Providencia sp. TaxID=589 RepID=UPI003342AD06
MAQVISDWLCVCASGKAIDGRTIEKSWLEDSAKNYNSEKYTAMIWPYHDETPYRQFTPNLGTVDSLKYAEEDGVGKLYARLVPNEFLIETNRQEQKMFTSAEFWPNFAETGEIYFSGIVVTDIPASLYTDKLKFSANSPNDPVRGEPLTFTLGKTQPYKTDKPSFIQKLFGFTSNQSNEQAEQPKSKENDTMTEELKALLEKLLEKLSTIEDKADGTTAETTQEAADDIADAAEEIADAAAEVKEIAEEIAENPEDEVLKEEFTAAKAHLEKLTMRFTGEEPKRRGRRGRRQFTARRSRREKSPAKKEGGTDVVQLTAEVKGVLEKFTALAERKTPKPNGSGAPGGEKETTVA